MQLITTTKDSEADITKEEDADGANSRSSQFYQMHQTFALIDKKLTRVGIN